MCKRYTGKLIAAQKAEFEDFFINTDLLMKD